jgi:hypothetical protein
VVVLKPEAAMAITPCICQVTWTNGGAWFAHDDLLLSERGHEDPRLFIGEVCTNAATGARYATIVIGRLCYPLMRELAKVSRPSPTMTTPPPIRKRSNLLASDESQPRMVAAMMPQVPSEIRAIVQNTAPRKSS